jgi:hypothetical protein
MFGQHAAATITGNQAALPGFGETFLSKGYGAETGASAAGSTSDQASHPYELFFFDLFRFVASFLRLRVLHHPLSLKDAGAIRASHGYDPRASSNFENLAGRHPA